jgi:phage terminase small subunit
LKEPGSDKYLKREHQIFIDAYVVHRNASAAARAAGYKSARNSGSRLLKVPEIKAEIDRRTQEHLAARQVDKQWVLDRIIEEIERAQASGTKSQTALKGLELLARHMGMFVERQEITLESSMLETLAERMAEGQARVLESKQRPLPKLEEKIQ